MSEKIYRFRVSTAIDQDIIRFLDSVPDQRRSELFRHMLRFYQSQLGEGEDPFLPYKQKEHPIPQTTGEEGEKEYKVRLDDELERSIIELIASVPRKRRSEFWRHLIRYYMNQLREGELFIMPSSLPGERKGRTSSPSATKKETEEAEPPQSLFENNRFMF
ncbi:hypothetical protein Cdeb_01339 [Caldibacillus debilis GB1]|uniref:Uncharacterized protein n=1 Tax=Caldibacillus debilis GB1 TaxID=1339248 RepID=A0A420VDW1_9BACI|nr:hypothetical protein Cdeb_01339 [Caldibacillus debilis GB1]